MVSYRTAAQNMKCADRLIKVVPGSLPGREPWGRRNSQHYKLNSSPKGLSKYPLYSMLWDFNGHLLPEWKIRLPFFPGVGQSGGWCAITKAKSMWKNLKGEQFAVHTAKGNRTHISRFKYTDIWRILCLLLIGNFVVIVNESEILFYW